MSKNFSGDPERDARLAALYRAAATDEPPAQLDNAIRAAARRAVVSRPRLAGLPFYRAWRLPLSVAAVLVLSVSLVTLMREEVPEITQSPDLDLSRPFTAERRSNDSVTGVEVQAPTAAGNLRPADVPSSGLGLKPSSSSGLGIRRDVDAIASAKPPGKRSEADRMEAHALPAPPRKEYPAEAFAGAGAMRDNKTAAAAEQAGQAVKAEARNDAVSSPESRASAGASGETRALAKADSSAREPERRRAETVPVAPAAKPAPAPAANPALASQPATSATGVVLSSELPPEKWLERIEELRKQGRMEDARASFADFRRRYPNYALPASLKDWVQ